MTGHQRRGVAMAVMAALVAGQVWGCSQAGEVQPPKGATTRWSLRDDHQWFGLISSAVRCGDVLFLADLQAKLRPLDVVRRRQLPILSIEGPPLALAADCERQLLYAVLPPASHAPEPTVVAVEFPSGIVVGRYRVPSLSVRGAYFCAPASLCIAGVVHPDPEALFRDTPAQTFYGAAHIGLRLSLTTGATEPLFEPYEQECIGGGKCLEVSLATGDDRSVVALPTSARIGIYDASTETKSLIDITSPRFLRTGRTLPPAVSAEDTLRWNAENSTIFAVYRFREHVVTIHARPRLGADWVFGQPVEFTVLLNLHSYDGRLVWEDIELPDLPIGQDSENVFVVDYGERGRAGTSPAATLSTIHIS